MNFYHIFEFENFKLNDAAFMVNQKSKIDHPFSQFNRLIENIPEAVFLIDYNSKIRLTNKKACEQLGYTYDELQKLDLSDISLDYIGLPFRELWIRIKQQGSMFFESRHIAKDGRMIPVEVKTYYVVFGDQEYLSCIAQDITKLKIVEENLYESSTLLEAVFDNIPDPIGILDSNFGALKYNSAALSLFGITETDYTGRKCYEIVDKFMPCKVCSAKEAYKTRAVVSKVLYISKLGKWLDARAYPILDENGHVVKIVEHLRDITKQKLVEEALRESEERYRSLIESSHDLIFIYQNEKISYANSKCFEISGFREEELYQKDVQDFVHPQDKSIVKAINCKNEQSYEFRIISKRGEIIHLELKVTEISFNNSNALLVTARDITERKKAEQKFYQTYLELEKSEKEKSLSHFVLDHAGEAIFIINQEGISVRANEMACAFSGYKYEDIKTMKVSRLFIEFTEKEWKHIWGKLEKGDKFSLESIHENLEGKLTSVEIDLNFIKYDGQNYALIFVRDITERKEAEKKINEHLHEIEELKNRLEAENLYLMDEIKLSHNFEEIITGSANFKRVLSNVEKVASTDSTVLITGETGTGKELLARAIHNISPRKDRPLVKVNCAALPAELIESELFGYEKGAFTGALTQKIGRFELADGGTIFLDEIGEMPLHLQPKLLRVLQDGEFERLGNPKTLRVDVRIIAATNRDLDKAILEKKFRPDLFYRLNVFPIHNPPLRERKEDIPLLVNYFILKFSAKHGKDIRAIPNKALAALQSYEWPGNIRELENIVERAIIVSHDNELQLGDWLKSDINAGGNNQLLSLQEVEKEYINTILNRCGWRIRGENGAANILGMKPTTLEARMKKLGIKRP